MLQPYKTGIPALHSINCSLGIATRTARTLGIRYNIVCHSMVRNMTLIMLKCGPERLTSDKVEENHPKIESVERMVRE